ncbi:MAG: DUF3465 domain-containing protein [Bdellovibrio sp.]|nr:DUF3465 domain-containing protein [Bdellovibrio sp.]
MIIKAIVAAHLIIGFLSVPSFAQSAAPSCLSGNQELLVNNASVIQWKNNTKNQYRNRAHILGTLVRAFPDHSGHHHYEVQIGGNQADVIEIIYNEQFGPVPQVIAGAQIEACGDYITSNSTAGHFSASPDGAIIHWVHRSPNPASHASGFMKINGIVCGQN